MVLEPHRRAHQAGLPDNGNRLVGALRELGFKVDDELAEEIRRGRDLIQLTDGPYDLDLVYAPDGIEGYKDAPPGGRDGRLPAVLDRRRHREQEAVEPGKGPGVAPAAGGLRPLPQESSHRRLSPCLRGTGAPLGLADGPRADAPHRAAGRAAASDRHGLAAVVEHVSELHELEPPGWSQEPERFVDIPDFFMLGWHRHLETAVYAPAPFILHGALANARDLDARGGERHVWIRGSRPDPRAFR